MKMNNRALQLENIPFFVKVAKAVIFCLLGAVGIILAVNNWTATPFGGVPAWNVIVPALLCLYIENAVKIWALKTYPSKIVCYVLDILLLMSLTIFSDGTLISMLYIVILSEFYITQRELSRSIAMCVSSIVVFLVTFIVSATLKERGAIMSSEDILSVAANAFNDLLLIVMHFLVINLTVQMYRKNTEINKTVEELHRSNQKLQAAYKELQEVTALEERQRIAKDIHDTAGHSITTVIMQTEAAKLIVDSNPEEAKRRIAAANLQAKHALEELRESVHLLSGAKEGQSLKEAILSILHESTDGTDLAIRSDVDDITLCDAKRRFLCNSLKEGISNGLRHGGATAFYFELKRVGDEIQFLLSDNGCGAELSSFREGFGLKGMQSRAESLGGSVSYSTEPDEGFEIRITLPQDGEKGEGK